MSERIASIARYRLPDTRPTLGFPRADVEDAITRLVNARLEREHVSPDEVAAVVAEEERDFFRALAERAPS
jgi:hypothetical protein